MKNAKSVGSVYLFGMILLLMTRIGLSSFLYRSGFVSLTADEFARVVLAARWAEGPFLQWYGLWLPLQRYMLGAALLLIWELLYVPRVVTAMLGIISIALMYQLSNVLFESRKIGFVSAVLLTVNPLHAWLSSTPLTEMPYTTFILAAMWSFSLYVKSGRWRCLYTSALVLALSNGLRYESWMVSIVFSLYVIGEALYLFRKDATSRQLFTRFVAAALPWGFPLVWMIGDYVATGIPLSFLTTITSYKQAYYGATGFYSHYLQTFLEIDPFATVLGVIGLVACLFHKSQVVRWYVTMAVVPFCIFSFLHRGQVEPEGNYLRYLAPFLFMVYPAVACLMDWGIRLVRSAAIKKALWALVVCAIAFIQIRANFQFVNDPAAGGLAVGQKIRSLRREYPDLSQRPVLIEVSYWQFLAIHVGANDLSSIMYDRSLDPARQAPSLLPDRDSTCTCLAMHKISFIIVKSPNLREFVEGDLGILPTELVNHYAFYRVPEGLIACDQANQKPCPLSFGRGY